MYRAIGVEPTNETAATPGMLEQRVDGDLVAVHDVEDAVRQAGLLEELGRQQRGGRVLLRGLEDEAVAAGDRGRPHPHGHHRGEVEGRDAGHHAEGLADRVDVDPGRGLLGELALDQRRDPARVLDHLEPARHLAEGVRQDLPVLGGEVLREVLAVRVEQLADAEEELGALRERHRPPRGPRLRGVPHGRVDLLDRREIDRAGLDARRRVEDRAAPARRPVDPLPADPVGDPCHRLVAPRGRRLGKLRHRSLLSKAVSSEGIAAERAGQVGRRVACGIRCLAEPDSRLVG